MANKVDNIDALLRDDLDREVKVPEAEAKSEPAAEDAAESIPEPAENAENEKQSGQMSYEDAIKAATARYQSAIEEETRRLAGLDEKDAPKAEPEADKADESAVSETEPESEETAEPKGPTTADDTEDYTREANRDPGLSYIDTEIEGSNLRHYEGYLGTFDYDPEQFELQIAKTEANQYGPASEREVLRYVGKEVDGNKIHIPEGIKNGEMMFAETNIVTPPKLPESLESGLGMFMGCKNLTRPNDHFPAALKEAPFMYAD